MTALFKEPLQQSTLAETAGARVGNNDAPATLILLFLRSREVACPSGGKEEWKSVLQFRVLMYSRCILYSVMCYHVQICHYRNPLLRL